MCSARPAGLRRRARARRTTSTAISTSTSTPGTRAPGRPLDIILGLWTQDEFSLQGEFYQVRDLTIAPKPVQEPHPPVYLAVSRTPASVDVAVERDLPILTSFSTPEADNLGLFSLYAERCAAAGKSLPAAENALLPVCVPGRRRAGRPRIPPPFHHLGPGPGRLRRTLTHGDEINVDLDHWRQTRTVEPASYESELENTCYFGTPGQCVCEDCQTARGTRHWLLWRQHVLWQHGAREGHAFHGAICSGSDAPVPALAAI